jgi:hypothetical protein
MDPVSHQVSHQEEVTKELLEEEVPEEEEKTIHVLIDNLPGGYEPIVQFYNANKPDHLNKIFKNKVAEGGFETLLEEDLLEKAKKDPWCDANSLVRQVRWYSGKLLSKCGYNPLTNEQTQLLFRALQHSCGEKNVVWC